jgi:hypothetical protein
MGAGNETATVVWPALKGLAMGLDPFCPDSSQLPIMSAADAAAGMARIEMAVAQSTMKFERVSN